MVQHPVLKKWLYLSEASEDFETVVLWFWGLRSGGTLGSNAIDNYWFEADLD